MYDASRYFLPNPIYGYVIYVYSLRIKKLQKVKLFKMFKIKLFYKKPAAKLIKCKAYWKAFLIEIIECISGVAIERLKGVKPLTS